MGAAFPECISVNSIVFHEFRVGLKKTCAKQCPVGYYKVKGKKTNRYWSRERGVNGLFGSTCEPCGSDCHDCSDLETCLKCQNSDLTALACIM